MLPREKRLVRGQDFDRVYQRGKRVNSKNFNLTILSNRQQLTRLGIVVGKKFSKKATERNRAKRVFREVLKGVYGNIPSGFDIVVFVKKTDSPVRTETITSEVKEVLKKIGVKK